MSEAREPLEDISAGVLNGVVIFAIGCVFPIAFLGQLAFQWGVDALDLRPGSRDDFAGLAMLSLASVWLIRTGFGLGRKNVLALLRRRRPTPAG
jgi:hypothetical protein